MNFLRRAKYRKSSNLVAKSNWVGTTREEKALRSHHYVKEINRVDQIWEWLKKNNGNVTAVNAPHASPPEKFSYKELAEKITLAASSFNALGIEKGNVVGLFSENSPRWLIADQGLMRLEACNAVRGATAPVEELQYILDDSESVALIIQTRELLEELSLDETRKKRFKFVLQLEGKPEEGVLGWEEFLLKGVQSPLENSLPQSNELEDNLVATILYTSGTTGKPKGVPLTHGNLLHQIRSLACIANPPPGTPLLSVLPIWHSYERSAEYYFFSCACSQTYTTKKFLKQDLQEVQPVVMATVPRLWEAVKTGFDDAIKKMPKGQQKILRGALSNSSAYKMSLRKSRDLLVERIKTSQRLVSLLEVIVRWPFHSFASLFLWPKVLKQLCGGRLRYPINGGGAIAPHVDHFFESVGVELLVGYGLTETSPVVSCRRTWRNIRGSAGLPLPKTEFRIVNPETRSPMKFRECGVVLVKGPQVMNGYLGRPEETKKVLDSNGWFDTGDLGMLLPDGSLVLTGRAKDTIVLSNGENIEPGPLEEYLAASPLIQQLMLVGQDERQLGALIVPNFDEILYWSRERDLTISPDLGGYPGNYELRKFLSREINNLLATRRGSRSDERVYGVAFVKEFSIDNGLLTQTLKQKREKITERDKQSIDSIYGR